MWDIVSLDLPALKELILSFPMILVRNVNLSHAEQNTMGQYKIIERDESLSQVKLTTECMKPAYQMKIVSECRRVT
jgi:hypothetical protein